MGINVWCNDNMLVVIMYGANGPVELKDTRRVKWGKGVVIRGTDLSREIGVIMVSYLCVYHLHFQVIQSKI